MSSMATQLEPGSRIIYTENFKILKNERYKRSTGKFNAFI
ncbi:hypothetical protein PMI17_00613 [Pantoea sp. GM01]|nr:hypothetical protein PMI17_00613 [Pantoea sp. GM01]